MNDLRGEVLLPYRLNIITRLGKQSERHKLLLKPPQNLENNIGSNNIKMGKKSQIKASHFMFSVSKRIESAILKLIMTIS